MFRLERGLFGQPRSPAQLEKHRLRCFGPRPSPSHLDAMQKHWLCLVDSVIHDRRAPQRLKSATTGFRGPREDQLRPPRVATICGRCGHFGDRPIQCAAISPGLIMRGADEFGSRSGGSSLLASKSKVAGGQRQGDDQAQATLCPCSVPRPCNARDNRRGGRWESSRRFMAVLVH